MKRLLFLLPLILFGVLAVYFAVGLTRDPRAVPSALIDKPVPQFSLAPLEGSDAPGLATADLKGKVRLVNIFASWCAPCRIEHPVLMRLAREYGIEIAGINQKDKPADAREMLEREGNPFARIGADTDGRASIEWGVYGIPETFVVDRDGRIRYRHVGPIMPQDLDAKILPIIRELQG
ncbi:DsbE family thiol:disulfide interchange protein [Arenibaculum pallidiluteum]|uniref:DsbE family thiol:disulfide interchange protein n=1 Tax=Arenibaculum pallidiluteum TaxID=2812559 RepID=UPI001A95D69E|nr:DsbE family thiol:disulfide interchange protein [Arenibaculum pallidiluteum]